MKKGIWISIGWMSAAAAFGNIGGFCAAVDAEGTNAYVGAGNILLVLDVSIPAAPVCSGSLYLPGPIEDVLVSGTNLYAACGEAGLLKIDPAGMERIATYDSSGHAYGLALAGASLYLADGVSGLLQLNAATLAVTGSFATNGPIVDVLADGADLYLLDSYNGVIALNAALGETGAYGLVAFGKRMETDGMLLCVADGLGNITKIDRATMTASSNAPAMPVFGIASGMAIDGSKLYVADGFGGLSIYDAATEALLGMYSAVARGRATAIASGLAYLASGNSGVKIFDLSDPSNPFYLSSIATSNALDVAATGNLLLVADTFQGLEIFDLGSPAAPVHLGSFKPPSPEVVQCVGAAGSSAYIATGYKVYLLDLSNPASPVLVGTSTAPEHVFDLDLPDPLTPVVATNFAPLLRALRLTLSADAAYASLDDGGTVRVPLPPDDDFDGDGLPNLHEQIAGTSPVDRNSVFAICGLDGDGGGFAVSWYSVAGRTYTIHKSTDLTEGFDVLQSGISATPPVNTHTDPTAGGCAVYMITIDP